MDEQQHNALELPKGLYEPVLRQPMELDFLLGQELSLCFHDLDGSHVFKTSLWRYLQSSQCLTGLCTAAGDGL